VSVRPARVEINRSVSCDQAKAGAERTQVARSVSGVFRSHAATPAPNDCAST